MNNCDINTLLDKLASGKYTVADEQQVQRFIHRYNNEGISGLTDEDFQEAEDEMWQFIEKGGRLKVKRILWWKPAIAAAMAIIIFGAGLFFYKRTQKGTPEILVYKNDIKPGKNRATITLENGKTIELSNIQTGVIIGNELTYNDGSAVANLSPSGRDAKGREGNNSGNPLSPQGGSLPEGERSRVQTLIASTPRGGTYQVTLPDGTRIWLNDASKISFPSQFSGKERKILLSGEAYFEVAKVYANNPSMPKGISRGRREIQKRIPFIVESKGQEVEVLGTHFNVSAYDDETSIKTTLLEGSVKVKPIAVAGISSEKDKKIEKILIPGQQSVMKGYNQIVVKQVDLNEEIAWKNGDFVFTKQSLVAIMKSIARWYDVQVDYDRNVDVNQTFSVLVSRNKNISQILFSLENTGRVKFKIEGKKVFVSQ